MKAQRPGRRETRPVPASLKYGETGETWGNLRVADAGIRLDQRFWFEDDAGKRLFQVTREFPDPLDPSKRLLFYEAVQRPQPGHTG